MESTEGPPIEGGAGAGLGSAIFVSGDSVKLPAEELASGRVAEDAAPGGNTGDREFVVEGM